MYPLNSRRPLIAAYNKIGQGYYRQVVGIPQGSILSTILCSFFYGDLERSFGSFTDNSTGVSVCGYLPGASFKFSCVKVLLRLIDDYLYVTTDPAKARKFLAMMNRGVSEEILHTTQADFLGQDTQNMDALYQRRKPWQILTMASRLWISLNQTRKVPTSDFMSAIGELIESAFPWCGFLIDMKDLSVTVDYSRYKGLGARMYSP